MSSSLAGAAEGDEVLRVCEVGDDHSQTVHW